MWRAVISITNNGAEFTWIESRDSRLKYYLAEVWGRRDQKHLRRYDMIMNVKNVL